MSKHYRYIWHAMSGLARQWILYFDSLRHAVRHAVAM